MTVPFSVEIVMAEPPVVEAQMVGIQGPPGPEGPPGEGGGGGGTIILNGIGLPDTSLGNIGDYYIDTQTRIMYGPKNNGYYPPVHAYGGPNDNHQYSFTDYPMTSGNSYIVDAGYISDLRYYRSSAEPAGSRTLRLYQVDGTFLSTSLPTDEAAGSDGWFSVPLPTPVFVTQGQEISVMCDFLTHRYDFNTAYSEAPVKWSSCRMTTTVGEYPTEVQGGNGGTDIVLHPATPTPWLRSVGVPPWVTESPYGGWRITAKDDQGEQLLALNNSYSDLAALYTTSSGSAFSFSSRNFSSQIAGDVKETGTTFNITCPTSQSLNSPGLRVRNSYIRLNEISGDPGSPGTDGASLYLKDNGAGKTQLCVKFATGAIVVLATQA